MKSKTSKAKGAASRTKRSAGSQQRVVSGHGYAWLCDFGLCHWAEPGKLILQCRGKPSPEAKAVPVRIVLESDWRKLNAR